MLGFLNSSLFKKILTFAVGVAGALKFVLPQHSTIAGQIADGVLTVGAAAGVGYHAVADDAASSGK